MRAEHEIPIGTRLYFGESAKLKREIERSCSELFYENAYEEIVTPLFSYHQHLSIEDEREVVRISDEQNEPMSLRADITIDAVRITQKRLGGKTEHKKWFYIQPVYRYPAREQYQIGAEYIEHENTSSVMALASDMVQKLNIKPLLQVSNIAIPKIISRELKIDISLFKRIEIEKLLALNVKWLTKLVYLEKVEQIDEIMLEVPGSIQVELQKLKELTHSVDYENLVVAPLYYAKMRYYDDLFFRFIQENVVLLRGGRYVSDGKTSVGFALYTDEVVEALMPEGNK